MPDQVCILCGATYTAPAHLRRYQGLCPEHWQRDILRELDRLESVRGRLTPGTPDTLTLAEWLAIVASYRATCALCEMNSFGALAIWLPALGLVAGNVFPACRACHYHFIHGFALAIDRVSADLAAVSVVEESIL